MTSTSSLPAVVEVDFSTPGDVDPADFGLEGLTSASARVSVDLSPSSGLGLSRLGQVRRGDAAALSSAGRSWFAVRTNLGPGALLLDLPLAVLLADLLLGGPGEVDPRPLTGVEEKVILPHLQRALEPLSAVFLGTGVGPLEVREPGRGALGLRGDSLIVEIVVAGAGAEDAPDIGAVTLVVPAPPVNRASEPAATGVPALGGNWPFLDVPLPLRVRTDVTLVAAARLRDLGPGEVLQLRHRCEVPLRLCVGPVDVGRATLGRHEENLAAVVTALLPPSSALEAARTARARRTAVLPPTMTQGKETPMSENAELDPPVAAALAAATDALDPVPAPATVDAAAFVDPTAALGLLAEVPVEVSVEVGRASVTLREAVALGPGQVVALDAEAGSLATVLVNGRAVARGQVVVVDEVYGVRISELVGE